MSLLDKPRALLKNRKFVSGASAFGGMIVGAFVGIAVQVGVESTGVLGPSIDALMAEQAQNFGEVYSRLDRLRDLTDDPDVIREIERIRDDVERQEQLSAQAGNEVRFLSDELVSLKEQAEREFGVAGGADFWLKNGEGVNIGRGDQVFGLRANGSNYADVTLTGRQQRLGVGDTIGYEENGLKCRVLVKDLNRRPDERIGFDFDCSSTDAQ